MSPEPEIPLDHLSDREILLLTAQTVNRVAKDHEKRLRWLERVAWGLAGAWILVSAWLGIHVSGGK